MFLCGEKLRLSEMGSTAADWYIKKGSMVNKHKGLWKSYRNHEIPNYKIPPAVQKSGLIFNQSANHVPYFISIYS